MKTTDPDILLIEPDRLLGENFKRLLQAHGYGVRLCHDAAAALKLAEQRPPQLLLINDTLPRNSSSEFLYEFRSYPEWMAVPVVLLSLQPEASLRANRPVLRQLGVELFVLNSAPPLSKLVDRVRLLLTPAAA